MEFRFGHQATVLFDGTVLVTGGGGNNADGSNGFDHPGLSRSEIYTPNSGTWTAAGTMTTARTEHTATLLSDGSVLVAGGMTFDTKGAIVASEVYYPTTHTWVAAGNLATARWGHTATLLQDGTVLVVGGQIDFGASTTSQSSSELYHPDTRTWTTTTDALTTGRFGHTATLLPNGTVLVAGGLQKPGNVPITSSEIYHPNTQTWTTSTGNLVTGRYQHTATLLVNGKVLIAGGVQFSSLASSELYDVSAQTWTATTGSLGTARRGHSATRLTNGTVLVAGGDGSPALGTCELYNPTTQTWSATTGALATGRHKHSATLLGDGRVLVTGGLTTLDVMLSSCELYSPTTGQWSSTAQLNLARAFHSATALSDGTVLVVAGLRSSAEADATHEIFDVTAMLTVPAITVAYNGSAQPVQPLVSGATTSFATITYQRYSHNPTAGGTLTGSAITTAPNNAGWYRVTATPFGSVSGAAANGLLTITPATMSVTAVSQVVMQGSTPAPLTTTFGMFQGTDTSAVIMGSPLMATDATANSPVGVYLVTVDVSGMSAANYSFMAVNGTISMTSPASPPPPTTASSGDGGGCGLGSGAAAWMALALFGFALVRFRRQSL